MQLTHVGSKDQDVLNAVVYTNLNTIAVVATTRHKVQRSHNEQIS